MSYCRRSLVLAAPLWLVASVALAQPQPAGSGYAATLPAHLRVAFVLKTLRHDVVTGDGVSVGAEGLGIPPGLLMYWQATSPLATEEAPIHALPAPPAGEELDLEPHKRVIYDGLVEDGCGTTPVFPIEFESTAETLSSEVLGSFEQTDDTTIVPNGFWNFEYAIEVADADGNVSSFVFRGVVSATCVSFDSYPSQPEDPVLPDAAPMPTRSTLKAPTTRSRREPKVHFLEVLPSPWTLHCNGDGGSACPKYLALDNHPLDPGVPECPDGVPVAAGDEPSTGLIAPDATAGGGAQCVVDFSDEDALQLTEPSLWFDRIYFPWFQQCENLGYAQLQPTVNSHFHLGFADPDVTPCFSSPDAYPSRIDEDGECDFVDIPTEARTYATSHLPNEVFRLRVWDGDYKPFDMDQIHVRSDGLKLCYYKAVDDPLEWEANEPGGPIHAWYCWSDLSPGTYDLSAWASNVEEVTLESAESSGALVIFEDILLSP